MKETVLLFHIQEKERLTKLKRIFLPMRFRIKIVNKGDYLQPIGYMAGVKEINPVEQTYDGEDLEQEMMVLAGMTGRQIDQVLSAMHRGGVKKINYKAVLTETNQYWDALKLYEELKQEHEAMTVEQE